MDERLRNSSDLLSADKIPDKSLNFLTATIAGPVAYWIHPEFGCKGEGDESKNVCRM